MRMQQLPLFHTAYADRDGHIAYVYNATLWKHATGDYRFWQGVVPGDKSELIGTEIVPYDEIPKVIFLPVYPLRIRMPRCARWVMPCGAAKPAANLVESSTIG